MLRAAYLERQIGHKLFEFPTYRKTYIGLSNYWMRVENNIIYCIRSIHSWFGAMKQLILKYVSRTMPLRYNECIAVKIWISDSERQILREHKIYSFADDNWLLKITALHMKTTRAFAKKRHTCLLFETFESKKGIRIDINAPRAFIQKLFRSPRKNFPPCNS